MAFAGSSDEDFGVRRTVSLLGGQHTLYRRVRNRLEAHDLLREGLPGHALQYLVGRVTIFHVAQHRSMEKAVGISLRGAVLDRPSGGSARDARARPGLFRQRHGDSEGQGAGPVLAIGRDHGDAAPRLAGLAKNKKATWIREGLVARVRHIRGEEKLRHATMQSLDVSGPVHNDVGERHSGDE